MESSAKFYAEALEKGTGFEGQLTDEFQTRLKNEYAGIGPGDCDFYHTMDFGAGEIRKGVWDLLGRERSYLGWVDVRGQRLLEIGPATGHLTFYMDKLGADVVAFDLPPGMAPDIVPQEGHDLDEHRRLGRRYIDRVRKSWWYGHRRLGSPSRAVYGDLYRLPSDLRRFDVSTLTSVLLHLSRPFEALRQVATITDKAVVITEPIPRIPADADAALLEFAPMGTRDTVIVWWQTSPGALKRMLRVFGFLEFTVHYHVQTYHPKHELDKPPIEALFFTLVAERHEGWAPRLAQTDAEREAEAAVRRAFSHSAEDLRVELAGLRSSLSWRLTRPVRMLGSMLRRAGLR